MNTRNLQIVSVSLLISSLCFSQTDKCFRGRAVKQLTWNDVRFQLGTDGVFFIARDGGASGYKVPANGDAGTMYSSSLWMGGTVSSGNLGFAGAEYGEDGYDFCPGPLQLSTGETNLEVCEEYDNIYEVSKAEVDIHKAYYTRPNYAIPDNILNWPGTNTISTGNFEKTLAPFVDVDGNGVYSPLGGDYPDIKGDLAAFVVLNDNGNSHSETLGEPIGLELQLMFYAVYTDSEPLNHTVFLDVSVFNRGYKTVEDFYLGSFTDFDIGYHKDDFCGTLYNQDAYFAYNGDDYDDEAASSTTGYGNNPPLQAVTLLNKKLAGTMYYPIESAVVFPGPSDPTYLKFYNKMRGVWGDRTPQVYGGNGYVGSLGDEYPVSPISGETIAKYVFPGDSDPSGESTGGVPQFGEEEFWTCETAEQMPDDFRMVGNVEPLETFSPGEEIHLSLAFVTSFPDSLENGKERLKKDIDIVRNHFNTQLSVAEPQAVNRLTCFPNPVLDGTLHFSETITGEVRNVLGQKVATIQRANYLNCQALEKGCYWVITNSGQVTSFVKE